VRAGRQLDVRAVRTTGEYRACQELQRRAWGIAQANDLVPVATMISVQHAGGLVLGAFDGERLVGFAFAYLGRVRGRWALYSQLAGVDPDAQSSGVGGLLKAAQRDWVQQQGLELVAWSFDPLQAGNANFNLHRLGAFCRTYYVDYFGERTDALSAGVDSDRLLCEWPVQPAAAVFLGEGLRPVDLIATEPAGNGFMRPVEAQPSLPRGEIAAGSGAALAGAAADRGAPPLHIALPAGFAALKQADAELARAWQRAVRAAFQTAFASGYVAVDFGREASGDAARGDLAEQGDRRVYYILRHPVTGSRRDP